MSASFQKGENNFIANRKGQNPSTTSSTEPLCKIVPTNVAQNRTFLLDTTVLKSWDDWKCDDMGLWQNNGCNKIGSSTIKTNDNIRVKAKRADVVVFSENSEANMAEGYTF